MPTDDPERDLSATEWQSIAMDVAMADGKPADEWPTYLRQTKLTVVTVNGLYRVIQERLAAEKSGKGENG